MVKTWPGHHDVVRVAGVLDLGQPRVERGAHDGGWIFGAQFEPCAEPGVIIVGCLVGELDAEAAAIAGPAAGAARRLAVGARTLRTANRSTLITRCLNLVAALRQVPRARWQCLNLWHRTHRTLPYASVLSVSRGSRF